MSKPLTVHEQKRRRKNVRVCRAREARFIHRVNSTQYNDKNEVEKLPLRHYDISEVTQHMRSFIMYDGSRSILSSSGVE